MARMPSRIATLTAESRILSRLDTVGFLPGANASAPERPRRIIQRLLCTVQPVYRLYRLDGTVSTGLAEIAGQLRWKFGNKHRLGQAANRTSGRNARFPPARNVPMG